MTEYTEDDKRRELVRLVREAYAESIGVYPNHNKDPHHPAFSPAGFQTYHQDTLVKLLLTTDALRVLNNALAELE